MIEINNRQVEYIDFIGDIHGHYDALVQLLEKLGYSRSEQGFRHENRLTFFVGDFIDRGPKIKQTLELVKSMMDSGAALAVMGNHEYNAIGFNLKDLNGGYKRPHLIKNFLQHEKTLTEFKNKQEEYDQYIEWFKTLPIFYEHDLFRVAHACWDDQSVKSVNEITKNVIQESFWPDAADKNGKLFQPLEIILKGRELTLPVGKSFQDKDGHIRKEIRVKWWKNPQSQSLHSLSVIPDESLPKDLITYDKTPYLAYPPNEKPVFFGHYWLKNEPNLYRDNVCCLDYSIAKGGVLASYQFSGEQKLSNQNFITVS